MTTDIPYGTVPIRDLVAAARRAGAVAWTGWRPTRPHLARPLHLDPHTTRDHVSSLQPSWYVIRTHRGQEFRAEHNLETGGI